MMKKHTHIGEGFKYHGNIWIITDDNGDLLTIRRYEGKSAIESKAKATEGHIIEEESTCELARV